MAADSFWHCPLQRLKIDVLWNFAENATKNSLHFKEMQNLILI